MKKYFEAQWNAMVILGVIIAFFVGVHVGGATDIPAIDKVTLANKETAVETTEDFAPFWKVWNTINEKYPNAEEVKDQEKLYGAIRGLVEAMNDPYTVFLNPDESKKFKEDIRGNFSGVGMEIGIKDKILTVIAPLKDTPAYRAGILAGDKIFKIDKTVVTSNFTAEEAVKLIRGEKGTPVTLTIVRDGESEPLEITVVRDIINIPTLATELRKDKIFVIKLYSFSGVSASLFRGAVKEFVASGSDKLLLDLRGNPGGYLDSAVSVSSWFLPEGKVVVTEDYGKDTVEPDVYRSRGYYTFGDNLKFVILIDGGSASASEIVAGAMQDYKRAKLVGTQSYGKGSVQEVVKVTTDTILKITIAKWLTPNGNTIAEKGLTPDYIVELTKEDIKAGKDPQMDKAVELLNNWPAN